MQHTADPTPIMESSLWQIGLGASAALVGGFIATQLHMLNEEQCRFASKFYFYPTMPLMHAVRYWKGKGNGWYMNVVYSLPPAKTVDETRAVQEPAYVDTSDSLDTARVYLGAAPLNWHLPLRLASHPASPAELHKLGVGAIVNLCDEYEGATDEYKRLGMSQLWIRTVDHFEPSLEHMNEAVAFIDDALKRRESVYIHCKAGHGRSAAIAAAWLVRATNMTVPDVQTYLNQRRFVRRYLYKQPNLLAYAKAVRKIARR
jgi:hypothetical protein